MSNKKHQRCTDLYNVTTIHKEHLIDGFTKKYAVDNLVYFETHEDIAEAILREKQIKKWRRNWKINLIEKFNPEWKDLFSELFG